MRVLTAMSGGVDSSVAALLLRRAGHDVVGVFLKNGVTDVAAANGAASPAREKTCCSASDARDAAAVAARLDVPFYALDYEVEFAALIDHFAAEYRRGRTPNPCVLCNQQLKFGKLFALADAVGAEAIATGHYARAEDGRLLRARDAAKDQTYFLFGIEREALGRARFPLGDLTKAEVRALAAEASLPTAEKPESMEICFVTSGDYRDVVRARGGRGAGGRFVDGNGSEVGRHDGVDAFTVGQRRGLPALGAPHYVAAIDAASGDVTLSLQPVEASVAKVSGVNWLIPAPPAGEPLRAAVKVRARAEAVDAEVIPGAGGTARIAFARPVAAVTPGQAAVFYAGDVVLGGGWLD